jgi:D-lactate dehydrogenase (cytochrome)
MNRILRVSAEDLDATVEAGVSRLQLGKALRNTGLMFPIDPGADATIGGMAATRASGTTAVRYGTMRENVLGLTVVLADGKVIRTGGRARKSSSGYDLTRLFVGSEGTLGVITEVTLRLFGRPEALAAAVCPFVSMESAVNTVIQTIQLGIPVARMEVIDETQLAIVNRFSKTSYPETPTLFFEFHGTSQGVVDDQARMVEEIAQEQGATGFQWASTPEARARLWQARHDVYYATLASRPGAGAMTTDVCVPISRLAPCILETQADALRRLLPMAHEGLVRMKVDPAERDRLLGVIEQRCLTGVNGATWQARAFHRQYDHTALDRPEALRRMLRSYRDLMHTNEPVHTWPVP